MKNEIRNHKDNVFCIMLQDKRNLLSIYNALNKTCYDDPEEIEVVTLGQSVCVSVMNDAAFLIDTRLNLYEHQSTVNPNMPLRDLYYIVDEYKKLIDQKSLYKSVKISIPEPKFVVFYNGIKEQPARQIYSLSDMYETKTDKPELELIVTVININGGYNDDLLNDCESLKGYTFFVENVRQMKNSGIDLEIAISEAIDSCIKEGMMSDFFRSNRSKIMEASIWEFNQELNDQAKFEDGYIRGKEEGQLTALKMLISQGLITPSDAAKSMNMTEEEFLKAVK